MKASSDKIKKQLFSISQEILTGKTLCLIHCIFFYIEIIDSHAFIRNNAEVQDI